MSIDNKLIFCEICGGKTKFHCKNCANIGLGCFYLGRFLYWGKKMNQGGIMTERLAEYINLTIKIIAGLFGLIGLASLVYWYSGALVVFSRTNLLEDLFFWKKSSLLILLFWFGLIMDMYLIYCFSESKNKKQKIKIFIQNKQTEDQPVYWMAVRKFRKKIDVSSGFGKQANRVLEEAYLLAVKYKQEEVSIKHVFYSLLNNQSIIAYFTRLSLPTQVLSEKIEKYLSEKEIGETAHNFSVSLRKALIEAYIKALKRKQTEVEPIDLVVSLVENDERLAEILFDFEIGIDKLVNMSEWFNVNERMMEDYKLYHQMARFKPGNAMDRAYTAVATPVLNHYSYDLTKSAKYGRFGVTVARAQEIEAIFEAFASGQRGIVLTGPAGVGKKTIVYGIARLMVEEFVPDFLKDKRLLELDIPRLISGANPAQAEERLLVMIDEIRRAGNIILFIDNIENIAGISVGQEESLELSEVLANAIERGNLYCLAAASEVNFNKYIEGKALGNTMKNIKIEEPEINQAIQMIESKAGYLEAKYKVYFSYAAIESAVVLSRQYIHSEYLPDKAIKILEATAVKVSKRCQADRHDCLCGKADVAEIVSEISKIPVTKVTENESKKLLHLEESFHKRMIGQEEAIKMVADSLRRARVNLREEKRPIASFLFLGPTGVGKTELAKTVSEQYFGDENLMIRLDMSEYQLPDSVNKMIGDQNGALGYLTEAVKKQPFALILLDEIEKAHPDILNLFLQVMDDGRLTDGQGRTIDFTNSIIIATSNAGAKYIQEALRTNQGVDLNDVKQVIVNEYLTRVMRPELINRFDGLIVFKPLDQTEVEQIAGLLLNQVAKMLEEKGVGLEINEEGLKILAKQGFDPQFGARPLRRLLQDKIENKIAEKFLAGEIKRRDTVVINSVAEIEIRKGKAL